MMKYGQERIKPYDSTRAKGEQVEAMFDNIAHSYDGLNHLLSLGIDRYWRNRALRYLKSKDTPTCRLLDIATGTGDFAIQCAIQLPNTQITACDISDKMMDIGHKKAASQNLEHRICWEHQNAMDLTYSDSSFDLVTSAYGIRNFENLEQGLSEMYRVLKQSGTIALLELATPSHFPMKQLFWVYSHCWMPLVGRLLSHDTMAYKYLPQTMEAFPKEKEMKRILQGIGFSEIVFHRYTFGLCMLYLAKK